MAAGNPSSSVLVSIEIVCTVHSACAVHRQNQVNVAPVSVAETCPQRVTISNLGTGGLTDSIKTFGDHRLQQLGAGQPKRPVCPAYVCCTAAPPGQCCRCCAVPIQTQSQNGSLGLYRL
ncbi:hypothetical protein Patl1_33913 [Pistacia atlantica]|uniref:Uncharacterized protein n=1 Tax=Pistacia atlantica TaxID=434234 RepID=A0ACC0ZWC5_9ROSI|nr:hypothetical protein Patl1_33913 [Pistacia atlantica]